MSIGPLRTVDDTATSVVAPAGVLSGEFVGSGQLSAMSNFSAPMYVVARQFALDAAEEKGIPSVALPTASVILASTALEAFLNEELEMTPAGDIRTAAEELRDARGLSLEARWILFLRMRCGKTFNRGAEPQQSFSLLCELRNLLVHRASRFLPVGKFPSVHIERLQDKYPFSRFEGMNATWDQRALNAACARWACNTAAAMTVEHYRVLCGPPIGFRWEPIP